MAEKLNTMSHTPGPWKLERCKCGHESCKSWLAGPRVHAEATLDEADARLIAAVPEMFDLLKQVERTFGDRFPDVVSLIDKVTKRRE